jgi:hypothetical protein
MNMPDCGDSSCRYKGRGPGGMRTNGGCTCDRCPLCSVMVRPKRPVTHHDECPMKNWIPKHLAKEFADDSNG